MINIYFIFLSILFTFFLIFSGIFGRIHKSKLSSQTVRLYTSRLVGGIIFLIILFTIPFSENPFKDVTEYIHELGLITSIYMMFDGSNTIDKKNIIIHPIYYYIAKIEYYLGWILLAVTGILFVYCKTKGI